MGDSGGGGGGWTVADTSTIGATKRSGAKGATLSSPTQQSQQHHHIRWSSDVLSEPQGDPGGGGGGGHNPAFKDDFDKSHLRESGTSSSSGALKRGGDGEDYSLDKLLDGLTELSQTLPGKSFLSQLTTVVKRPR